MARCSICYTVIRDEAEVQHTCPECKQDYHQSCWNEIGGCGTYGCKQAAVAEKPPVPVVVGQGWGDTKECPSCGMQISSSLLVCGCRARFPWADPMTRGEYAEWRSQQEALGRARTLLIWMFILSLFVFPAPLTGLIAGVYAFFRRKLLAGTGGTYLAMGYGSAALGAIYTILIVVVALGH
jgi:hypothetical protein